MHEREKEGERKVSENTGNEKRIDISLVLFELRVSRRIYL